jgi:hypothetical protein
VVQERVAVEELFLGWDAPATSKVREFLLPQPATESGLDLLGTERMVGRAHPTELWGLTLVQVKQGIFLG